MTVQHNKANNLTM